MSRTIANFHSPDEPIYQNGASEIETTPAQSLDLEQVDQFQPEVEPRSTTSAITDLYASSQSESHRHREQGDPEEWDSLIANQYDN